MKLALYKRFRDGRKGVNVEHQSLVSILIVPTIMGLNSWGPTLLHSVWKNYTISVDSGNIFSQAVSVI